MPLGGATAPPSLVVHELPELVESNLMTQWNLLSTGSLSQDASCTHLWTCGWGDHALNMPKKKTDERNL